MHPGQAVPVTLRFADARHLTARFAVRVAIGAPAPGRTMPSGPGPKMHMSRARQTSDEEREWQR